MPAALSSRSSQWLYSPLELSHTPSIRNGFDPAFEADLRAQAVKRLMCLKDAMTTCAHPRPSLPTRAGGLMDRSGADHSSYRRRRRRMSIGSICARASRTTLGLCVPLFFYWDGITEADEERPRA